MAQLTGMELARRYLATMERAKSLSVEYTVQAVPGSPSSYRVELQKPDRLRIETPERVYVGDGKKLVTLLRGENKYTEEAQTATSAQSLLAGDPHLRMWAPFFGENPFQAMHVGSVRQRQRQGEKLNSLELRQNANFANEIFTLFLNDETTVRQAQLVVEGPRGNQSWIYEMRALTVDATPAEKVFAFAPPAGAKKVDASELSGFRWLTNLEEAKQAAKKQNKLIFVDFYAEWCGPCKMLEKQVFSTAQFKAMHKDFVFLKIDVDVQPAVSKQYGVEAMPTMKVLRADGSAIDETVGFQPVGEIVKFMESARRK